MFNFWRPYPLLKPRKPGAYLCTLKYVTDDTLYIGVISLSYLNGKWIDRTRQMVFDGYKVYKTDRAPIEDNRVYSDGLCTFDDHEILAWKKMPKAYGRRKKKVK